MLRWKIASNFTKWRFVLQTNKTKIVAPKTKLFQAVKVSISNKATPKLFSISLDVLWRRVGAPIVVFLNGIIDGWTKKQLFNNWKEKNDRIWKGKYHASEVLWSCKKPFAYKKRSRVEMSRKGVKFERNSGRFEDVDGRRLRPNYKNGAEKPASWVLFLM